MDGINQRLDRLNRSVGHLQVASNKHENEILVLQTEKNFWGKLLKPAALILVAILAAVLGDASHITSMLDFLK